MKLAIISSYDSPNTLDLKQAASQAGIDVTVYPLAKLVLSVDEITTHPFLQHDAYIFRAYDKNFSLARSLAQFLVGQGKLVIDRQLASNVHASKLHEALVYNLAHIPHIPTYTAQDSKLLLKSKSFNYPVVIKDISSQKGKGVRLCHSEAELISEVRNNGHTILIQEYLNIKYDIRVLCVGDEILGAIKRESTSNDFRTNVSLGGHASVYALTDTEKELALKAHRAFDYDISGVDLAHDENGDPFVIEVNIAPEWQGFKSATGIDVGSKVINYILKIGKANARQS